MRQLASDGRRVVMEHSTNRSEYPFWLLTEQINISSHADDQKRPMVVELPSRHIQNVEYWIFNSERR